MRKSDDSMMDATARFATTRWSVVVGAQGQAAGADATDDAMEDAGGEALAALCETYWPAVYAYLRRRGHAREDARDLAQGFFTKLLEKDWLARADVERGSFRAFLVTVLRRYVAGEYERDNALCRGGGARHVTIPAADSGDLLEPASDATPDRAFDEAWTRSLLARVLDALREEYRAMGQGERFQRLEPYLVPGDDPAPFRSMAAELGIAESSCRVAVFRARRRYRDLLRAEIGSTVGGKEFIDAELDALIAAESGSDGSSGNRETGERSA